MVLPLVQLIASILTWIWIEIGIADFPDKKASLKMIGKITLWSFLGALAGTAIMMVGFAMLNL